MLIEIAGIPIEITKKKIKNMHLRIYPPFGEVKVSAPLHFKDSVIKQFIEEKYSWIKAQRKRMLSKTLPQDVLLQTGESLTFKGQKHLLIIEEQHGPTHVHHNEGFIYCFVPPNSSQSLISNALDLWYKSQMTALLPSLISHWQTIIGVDVAAWGIKKMKTRWGSCNTKTHRIWLNLNLIKKPLSCLEYVLVHELVHLHEASHNRRFYQLMDHFMPLWRDYDYLLEGRRTRK